MKIWESKSAVQIIYMGIMKIYKQKWEINNYQSTIGVGNLRLQSELKKQNVHRLELEKKMQQTKLLYELEI
jgi:hypothetical protein